VVRKTITLPESAVETVNQLAADGESFSATVVRLIEEGARSMGQQRIPSYVGSGEGPPDLSLRVDEYLRAALEKR
jgi:hypothetical protein